MPGRTVLSRINVLVILMCAMLLGVICMGLITQVRNSAERMQCANNLHQIGLAVHNYFDTYERLPPLTDEGQGAPTGCGLPSAFANLMPFIEQTSIVFHAEKPVEYYHAQSSMEFHIPFKMETTSQFGGVANQSLRIFLDPADKTADRLRDVPITLPDGSTGYYATGSYAANGMLPWGTGRLSQLVHGTENTVLIGERPQVCKTSAGNLVYNLWGLGIYSPHMPAFATLTPSDPAGLLSTGQVAPVTPLPDEGAADRDAQIRVQIGRQDAAPEPPDFVSPIQIVRSYRPCDPRLPGGPHPEGLQVLMADGSYRIFGPGTSPWVFWNACVAKGAGDR
jgi:hypothetical protein